jgi:tryptophan-rich sensory protein
MKSIAKSRLAQALPKYIVGIAIPLSVGALSALLTRGNMSLYSDVVAPSLAPPPILFPIVWTVLYVLMGISSTTVFLHRNKNLDAAERGLKFYILSLILNFIWSPVFFNRRAFLLALVILVLLFATVLYTVINYRKSSPVAAYLQIPYLVWLAFAAYLNLFIIILN